MPSRKSINTRVDREGQKSSREFLEREGVGRESVGVVLEGLKKGRASRGFGEREGESGQKSSREGFGEARSWKGIGWRVLEG
jgi:hypothetical protein